MGSGKTYPSTTVFIMVLVALSATIAQAAAPAGELSIAKPNNGYTKSAKVTLAVSNSDSTATNMCISNTASSAAQCTAWTAVPLTAQPWLKTWYLAAGDGDKTVYAYLKNKVTGEVGALAPATITLDALRPVNGKVSAAKLGNNEIRLDWTGFADGQRANGATPSGIANYVLAYRAGRPPATCLKTALGPEPITIDPLSATYNHANLPAGVTYGYRLCALDKAGNLSTGATVSAKAVPELDPPALVNFAIGSGEFTRTAAVKLAIDGVDASTISKMCISNTQTCTAWRIYAPTALWTLLAGDGQKTVNLWLKDQWDNVNAEPYAASTLLDGKAPVGGTLTAALTETTVALNWPGFTDAGSGIAGYKLVTSATAMPASCAAGTELYTGADTTFSHDVPAGKTYYYRVCATDNAGNSSVGATTSIKTTNGNAADLVKKALAFLVNQNFASASIAFESALIADPNNKDANFGSAITKGIMLVENQTVKDVIARWGVILPPLNQAISASSPVGNPLASLTTAAAIVPQATAKSLATKAPAASMTTLLGDALSSLGQKLPILNPLTGTSAKTLALAPADAPTVSEMQAAIDTVIIPELKTIVSRLAKVEGSGYTFTVTADMQGNPYGSPIVLSDGEFYTLDGVLNGVLTLLNMATAYNLDVADYNTDGTRNDYNAISQDPLKTLNNPSFFTLKATGIQKMATALANIKTAVTKAESAFAIVRARSAGQGAFDLSTWTPAQKAEFQDTLDTIQQFLGGQVTQDGLTVNAPRFFTAPLTRLDLPTLGYDVPLDPTLSAKYNSPVAAEKTGSYTDYYGNPVTMTEAIYADIVPKSDLPDYTLNGILPYNTRLNNVAGFNGLLPVSAGYVLRDASGEPIFDTYNMWPFTTNGADIYCVNNSGNQPVVRKITTAGVVTEVATLSDWNNALVWYNGSFYLGKWYGENFGLYQFDAGWNLASEPTIQLPLGYNQWVTAATASGTNLYYALSSWNDQSWTSTYEIHRLSDLGTALEEDSLLFTTDNYVNAIAYADGYLYLNDNELSKYSLNGTRVATYTNGSFDVLLGGNLYETEHGKLLKKAAP